MAAEAGSQLLDSAALIRETAAAQVLLLAEMAQTLIQALTSGHKVLLCGNGGSAADAQHVATELVTRYRRERRALPAIALGTDVTYLTAASNDYDFSRVFARQVEALGSAGDVLWAFSTSGTSSNVLLAAETARQQGLTRIAFSGLTGGHLKAVVDLCLCVPSEATPRIQEVHIAAAHVICDLIEEAIVG